MTPEESLKYLQKSIFHLFSGASSLVSERDRGRKEKKSQKETAPTAGVAIPDHCSPLQTIPYCVIRTP